MFFYLCKLLFSGFFQFKGTFVPGRLGLITQNTVSSSIRIKQLRWNQDTLLFVFMVLLCFINRFKVKYKRDETEDNQDGEILLIVPRKPSPNGDTDVEDAAARSTDPFPAFHGLHPGMVLKQTDVDKLTFCCCECCHRRSCRGCSSWFCNAFPQHITANQFFTPRMFEAYHREGYRACKEAEDWFEGERQQGEATENIMLVWHTFCPQFSPRIFCAGDNAWH